MKIKTTLIILLILTLLSGCKDKKDMPTEQAIRPVRYAKILKSQGAAEHTFSGIAQSSKESNLSFKVAGTVNGLKVKVGDKVRRGQLIATLDPVDYNIQYEQALAQLKSAETQIKSAKSQLVAAKSTYQRVEKLYENNSVPLSEYEQAKTNYEASQSQYDATIAQMTASKKQVDASKNQVTYARLTAPYAGIVSFVYIEENELVNSGTPIVRLTAQSKPEVRIGVPELYIAKVKKGQKVTINFSILPKDFKGTVSEVSFSSAESSTYPVIVQIDQPSKDIRPGMAANVSFNFDTKKSVSSSLVAPVKSVGEDAQGKFVYIIHPINDKIYQVKKQDIEIGALLPNGFEIKKGLKEGDLVATAGIKSLLDGMKVRLLE